MCYYTPQNQLISVCALQATRKAAYAHPCSARIIKNIAPLDDYRPSKGLFDADDLGTTHLDKILREAEKARTRLDSTDGKLVCRHGDKMESFAHITQQSFANALRRVSTRLSEKYGAFFWT
jgi:hypothetical protein